MVAANWLYSSGTSAVIGQEMLADRRRAGRWEPLSAVHPQRSSPRLQVYCALASGESVHGWEDSTVD